MLKKENRLKQVSGAKGKVLETSIFNIKIFKSGEKISRFGFVVSKKVSRKAVLRNKTKRVLSQAAREVLSNIPQGLNIVVYAKKILNFNEVNEVKDLFLGGIK